MGGRVLVAHRRRKMMSVKISPAAQLVHADEFDRIINPGRKKIDKLMGRIPKGQESPFGDFPRDYSRPDAKALANTMLKLSGAATLTPRGPQSARGEAPLSARSRQPLSARGGAQSPLSPKGGGLAYST